MQTMRPYPRATIPSFARQTEWNVPSRLTRMISRQVSTDMDRASAERAMPALATRRSTGPRSRSTASNIAPVASWSPTSAR